MRTFHQISAIFLLAFIVTHLGNHIAAAFGPKTFNAYLSAVRPFYRHPVVEPALIALFLIQAFTGSNLIIGSFRRDEKRSLGGWLELFFIVVFTIFIIIHLSAIAVTRFHFEMQTDFYWVAELFRASALQPFILSVHFLGVVAVAVHVGIGLKYMFRSIGLEKPGDWAAMIFIILGVVTATLAVAAYSGALYSIDLNN